MVFLLLSVFQVRFYLLSQIQDILLRKTYLEFFLFVISQDLPVLSGQRQNATLPEHTSALLLFFQQCLGNSAFARMWSGCKGLGKDWDKKVAETDC